MRFHPEPILAIETSCDETSAAVVCGQRILSNIVASQADLHRKWGGVVPEAAARAHVEAIVPVIDEALRAAGVSGVSAIGVTNRPGLVGALSVGISAAKALALAWDIPLLGIHHIEGHILSVFAHFADESVPAIEFPHLSLVVSGGHTELVLQERPLEYKLLGQTLDDAAGEAFDKGARLLGLGYPGGYAVQMAAESGTPRYPLPRALAKDPFNLSFSGLKTAVLRLVEQEGINLNVSDAAASLQAAIVDVLALRAENAIQATHPKSLGLVGGVAANLPLRNAVAEVCRRYGVNFRTPPPAICTDNAAMIGIVASARFALGERDGHDLDAFPNAPIPGIA